nr:MAG TPA_asm: hypothetical protein [Caudoviricetes sp.]
MQPLLQKTRFSQYPRDCLPNCRRLCRISHSIMPGSLN